MGWSHVRDQWPENENVYALADCEDDRNAGEETGRSELRVDERRWQHREQADRKKRAGRRESVCAFHPCHDAHRRDLRDDDEARVDEDEDPDRGGAERCVGLCKWRQDVGEERVADDDEHDIGCDHSEEETSSSDGAKASSGGVCRSGRLGSRARYGSEHDERESDVGYGVEEIECLERAEPLCGCDEEAGYGRAEAETEVARDAAKREGGRSLLALDQPYGQCPVGRPCRTYSGSADNRAGKGLPRMVHVGEAGVAYSARQASCDHDRFGGVPVEQRSSRR